MAFEKGRTSQMEESWGLSVSLALNWLARERSPARTTTSGPQTSPSAYVSMKIVVLEGSSRRGQMAFSAVMLSTAWPVTMVTAQRLLLWPEADDDWLWIFNRNFLSRHFLTLYSLLPRSVHLSVFPGFTFSSPLHVQLHSPLRDSPLTRLPRRIWEQHELCVAHPIRTRLQNPLGI